MELGLKAGEPEQVQLKIAQGHKLNGVAPVCEAGYGQGQQLEEGEVGVFFLGEFIDQLSDVVGPADLVQVFPHITESFHRFSLSDNAEVAPHSNLHRGMHEQFDMARFAALGFPGTFSQQAQFTPVCRVNGQHPVRFAEVAAA